MSKGYVFTPRALNDLDEIWNYIATDNENAASSVESAIFAACESLVRHPLIGSKRIEITPLPVLAGDGVPELRCYLPPGNRSALDCCRGPRQARDEAALEAAIGAAAIP